MISVRLFEDEYSALVNLCESSGARSVSDFARGAMRFLVGNGELNYPSSPVDAKGLQSQILLLSRKLDELNERIKEGYGQGLSSKSSNGSA